MRAVKALLMEQATELDALKEDVHAMQRRLAELEVRRRKDEEASIGLASAEVCSLAGGFA